NWRHPLNGAPREQPKLTSSDERFRVGTVPKDAVRLRYPARVGVQMIDKRRFILGSAALAATALVPSARAQTAVPYPSRVVTLVTHSSPGAGSDVVLREMLKYLQKYIAATFVIENDEGGSGAKAVARVAAAKPDGSMFYAATPTYVLTSLLSKPPKTY